MALLALFSAGCVDRMIFPAPPAGYDDALPGLNRIADGDGRIAALWLPAPGATTAVLYFHGNGEDLGYSRDRIEDIRSETGCSVLAIDYPGYGLSTGEPSESGCYHAAECALIVLERDHGFTPDKVVLFGRSLGTGVAVDLAARRRVKGLVLVSPYTSTFRVVTRYGFLPFDRFDNLSKIGDVTCPLFIAHGDLDEVIPYAMGREIFESADHSRDKRFLTLAGMRHNDPLGRSAARPYWDGVRRVTGGAAGI